jgi:hypothetical protein
MSRFSLVLAAVAAAAAMTTSAQAQNYPWCAIAHDGAGVNCGFATYEQCLATANGSGGYCSRNDAYRPSAGTQPHGAPRTHRRRKRS